MSDESTNDRHTGHDMDDSEWSRDDNELDPRPLLRDVAFNSHSKNAAGGWHHVSPLAQGINHVGIDGIQVRLLRGLPPRREVAQVMSRAMNATTGFDVKTYDPSLVESDELIDEHWEDILRGGLQAVMEAFVIVFEVSGVSRACTHQIVRSRRAGFHQQSQRATSYVDIDGTPANVRVPESVWREMQESGGVSGFDVSEPNQELIDAWTEALFYSRRAYRMACEADISYQDARYILPEGTENYIMCEYSLREFLAVYDYRACSMFNWEIVHVVREMGRLLKDQSPWIIGTGAEPRISCEKTRQSIDGGITQHACTFQGWEKVDEQCDFPWARETNRTFKPSRSI
jgi:thymidylate synthase (FAD)